MLKIQEYISCFENIETANFYLHHNLGLKVSSQEVNDVGLHFKAYSYSPGPYSDVYNPIVRETRGLYLLAEGIDPGDVITKMPDWPIVIDPTKEDALIPEEFELCGALAEEVPDGTDITIYNFDGLWLISTEEDCLASNSLPNGEVSYEWAAKHTIGEICGGWDNFLKNVNPFLAVHMCYVGPANKKILPYTRPEVYLMNLIDLERGRVVAEDVVNSFAAGHSIRRPHSKTILNAEDLSDFRGGTRMLSPGVLLTDKKGQQVMIKNPTYEAVKSALNAGEGLKPIHIAKIVQACRDQLDKQGFAMMFPNWQNMANLLYNTRKDLHSQLMNLWMRAKDLPNQKDFALAVRHHPLNCFLFKLKGRYKHMHETPALFLKNALREMNSTRLVELARSCSEKKFRQAESMLN